MAGAVGLAAVVGRVIPDIPSKTLLAAAIHGMLLVIAFLRPFWGLVFMTFAMLLAPEMVMGEAGARDITMRLDDFFVVTLAVGWLAHCAVVREAPLFPDTPFTRPMGWWLAVCVVTTCRAMMMNWVEPLKGMFFLLKYAEYFLLMFLVLEIVRTERQAKGLLWCGLLTAAAVAWLGWGMHLRGEIVGTPFQREGGEGATYGAYMILIAGLLAGLMLESRLLVKPLIGAVLVALFPPFMYTNSRASYLGLAVASGVLLLTARRGRTWLAPFVAAGVAMLVLYPPPQIKEKMGSTFVGQGGTFFGLDVSADESVTERLWRYEAVLRGWVKQPLLGYGVGGPEVEGLYINLLSQTGALGLTLFLVIGWRILRLGWQIRRGPHPPWVRGLGQGLVAGFAGLLGHALTANTFQLIRVMEPLWLTVGLLLILRRTAVVAPAASRAQAPSLVLAPAVQAGA